MTGVYRKFLHPLMPLIAQFLLDGQWRFAKGLGVFETTAQTGKANVCWLADCAFLPRAQKISKGQHLGQQGFRQVHAAEPTSAR